MADYPLGTTVRLKSGGPLMTVILEPGNMMMPAFGDIRNPVKVGWFDKMDCQQSSYFDTASLEVVTVR